MAKNDTVPQAAAVHSRAAAIEKMNADNKAAVAAENVVSDAEIAAAKKAGKGHDGVEPGRFKARAMTIVNPYTGQSFHTDRDTLVTEVDSWHACQVQANVLLKVDA